jgi:hypothetical protein
VRGNEAGAVDGRCVTALRCCFEPERPLASKIKMDSSFRWNDDEVVRHGESARTLQAWIPAFAGMTASGKLLRIPNSEFRIPNSELPVHPIDLHTQLATAYRRMQHHARYLRRQARFERARHHVKFVAIAHVHLQR